MINKNVTIKKNQILSCRDFSDPHPRLFGSSRPLSPVINSKLGIHHLWKKERKTPGPVISRTLKEKSNQMDVCVKDFPKKTHLLSVFFLVLFLKFSAVRLKCPTGANCAPVMGTVTSLWTVSRSVSSCQPKKSWVKITPKDKKNQIWSSKSIRPKTKDIILANQWRNRERYRIVTKAEGSEEDSVEWRSRFFLTLVSNKNDKTPRILHTNSGSHPHTHPHSQYTINKTARSWSERERERERIRERERPIYQSSARERKREWDKNNQ